MLLAVPVPCGLCLCPELLPAALWVPDPVSLPPSPWITADREQPCGGWLFGMGSMGGCREPGSRRVFPSAAHGIWLVSAS